MRSDPTDNGGLFVGRRPGTRPVKYRELPAQSSERRRRRDGVLAGFLLGLMIGVALLFWGPIPVGWLWIMSHIPFFAHHIFFGLIGAFSGILGTYMIGLMAMKQLDRLWVLTRRAAGVDQRDGVIGRVFAYTAVVGATVFSVWLIFFGGLADSLKNSA